MGGAGPMGWKLIGGSEVTAVSVCASVLLISLELMEWVWVFALDLFRLLCLLVYGSSVINLRSAIFVQC